MGGDFGFTLGRSDGFPTRYGDQHTAAHVDVLVAGIITAFVIFGIALLAIIPSYNTFSSKAFLFCRILCSLFIGGVIVGCNYGHDWEKGVIKMSSAYKPGVADEIKAELGLHIALRGINITLKGDPFSHHSSSHEKNEKEQSSLTGERIDYNEHFSWEWAQGRFGFGKYAGRFSREFREGVLKGLPYPILQVAEYFTFDGEGIRFGRHYRAAGWYSHLILWFAFGTWIIANILFCLVIRTAALFLFFTGGLQLATDEHGKDDVFLETKFGPDFYLVLANGVFCIILSGIISIMDDFMPDEMCQWFGIDPLTIYDELLLSKAEIKEENRRLTLLKGKPSDDIEMQASSVSALPSGTPGLLTPGDAENNGEIFLRKRSHKSSFIRQSFKIKPRIPRRSKEQTISGHGQDVTKPLLHIGGQTSESDDAASETKYGTSHNKRWSTQPGPSFKVPPRVPPKPSNL